MVESQLGYCAVVLIVCAVVAAGAYHNTKPPVQVDSMIQSPPAFTHTCLIDYSGCLSGCMCNSDEHNRQCTARNLFDDHQGPVGTHNPRWQI